MKKPIADSPRAGSQRSRLLWALALSLSLAGAPAARAAISPEKQAAEISRLLKPIPDSTWQEIAGERVSELYTVTKGDTLWDVSKRLFGDAKYWPKIWALNNGSVTNPHVIRPGKKIAFMSGTGTALPGVAIGSAAPAQSAYSPDSLAEAAPAPIPVNDASGKSQEWKLLPKQKWESVEIALPPGVDPLGFDRRNKVTTTKSRGLSLEVLVASDELDSLGEIVGSKFEGSFLSLGDLIYIEPDDTLVPGRTYAITNKPRKVKGDETGNNAYAYRITGSVQILNRAEDLYIGRITQSKNVTVRGNVLIPQPPLVPVQNAIPGPSPLKAAIIVDREVTSYETAQHKYVFVDRGSDDGIRPGMVFRHYQDRDAGTNDHMFDGDFVPFADFQVVQVSTGMSTAIVINSYSTLRDELPVVLLTDVRDINRSREVNVKVVDGDAQAPKTCDPNDIECLTADDSLGQDEERELKQLEDWKKNGAEETPPPPPSDTDAEPPMETAPPPPPEEEIAPPPPPESTPEDELPEPAPEDLAPPPEQ
jgi:hypothetical protein